MPPNDTPDPNVRYDLAGNPLPTTPQQASPAPDPNVQYDLAGNPLPPRRPAAMPEAPPSPQPSYNPQPPMGTPMGPGPGSYSPPGGQPASRPIQTSENKSGSMNAIIGGVICLVGIGIGLAAMRGLKPSGLVVPTAYTQYIARDKAFRCDQPTGWHMNEMGVDGGNGSWVTFKSGSAKVEVSSDLMGSLMGDIMVAPPANPEDPNTPPPPPPVIKVHEFGRKEAANKFSDYQEGEMQELPGTKMGNAVRVSEWTAKGGMFQGKIHGFRMTYLGHERRITVLSYCSDSDWPKLQGAFTHIITSVMDDVPQT